MVIDEYEINVHMQATKVVKKQKPKSFVLPDRPVNGGGNSALNNF